MRVGRRDTNECLNFVKAASLTGHSFAAGDEATGATRTTTGAEDGKVNVSATGISIVGKAWFPEREHDDITSPCPCGRGLVPPLHTPNDAASPFALFEAL